MPSSEPPRLVDCERNNVSRLLGERWPVYTGDIAGGHYHMKFFLDTANLDELKKAADWGIVDGVTTNPSLIAKEGRPIAEQIKRICDIVDGDISAEVVSTTAPEMVKEGREL